MRSAITINNLSKHFGGLRAIDELSIEIPHGVATGLIGPNGSGKTTLMNVLTGLLTPESGTIEISSHKSMGKIYPTMLREYKVARTFQDGRLVEQLSVEDNLLLTVAECGCWKSLLDFKHSAKLEKVLETIHLTAYRYKLVETLSYGQRKLLEIGRILMQDADICFFDEPFTGLFPEVVEQVLEILQNLKLAGKTLVVIEHNMGLIERLCDYTIVLDYGKLLAQGKPEAVLQNKQVRAAYLGV